MGFPSRPAAKGPAAGPFLPPMDGRAGTNRPSPDPASTGTTERLPRSLEPPESAAPLSPGQIQRSDLPPLQGSVARPARESGTAPESGAAPAGKGTDVARLERLLIGLALPPRSPALARLFGRLMTEAGDGRHSAAPALQIEALYRTGALEDAARLLPTDDEDPVVQALAARIEIARGRNTQGCAAARLASAGIARLPLRLAGEVIATQGYCAASAEVSSAGLFASLVRETESASSTTVTILEALAGGYRPAVEPGQRLSALDYRLLQLGEPPDWGAIVAGAEPALLAVMAADPALDSPNRLRAAEAAAAAGIIAPEALAAQWRAIPASPLGGEAADPAAPRTDAALRRAGLFRAIETERTPLRRARLVRTLLDDVRRNDLYHATLPVLARAVEDLAPVAEVGWFAETAIEVLVGAARYDRARAWVRLASTLDSSRSDLGSWLALVDIAEAGAAVRRGDSLGSIEDLALRGRFGADALHRLAAVLDALDYNVPIRLWEAASRAPQPARGHLPETGVLAELQAASRQRDSLALIALAIRSIGPGRAEQANILALGDVIRALRRAGYETEARRLAYEALVVSWPRIESSG